MIDVESREDMDAFHRWMNDPRVHAGWGEAGTEEKHKTYVRNMWKEPSVFPLIMNWDGERMGYAELVWIKVLRFFLFASPYIFFSTRERH